MMFLDVMPDILNSFFRSGIVKKVRLEQKPLHSDEREMVVFKDQVLHIEEGPRGSPSKDSTLHLLIDGCARVRGENGELSDIGIEPFGKTDGFMNHLGRFMLSPQDIGRMNLKTIPFKHLHGMHCGFDIDPLLQFFKGLRIEGFHPDED